MTHVSIVFLVIQEVYAKLRTLSGCKYRGNDIKKSIQALKNHDFFENKKEYLNIKVNLI